MNKFLGQFQSWVHWFAGLAVMAATLYVTNDGVHQAVNQVLASHKKAAGIVGAVTSIILAYAKAQKLQPQAK